MKLQKCKCGNYIFKEDTRPFGISGNSAYCIGNYTINGLSRLSSTKPLFLKCCACATRFDFEFKRPEKDSLLYAISNGNIAIRRCDECIAPLDYCEGETCENCLCPE